MNHAHEADPGSLPDTVVPATAYDEHYYLNWCAGYEEWRASAGARVAPVYAGVLARARFTSGEVVVDIGTGRAELAVVAAELGAAQAIGIEYSPAAVELARQTIAAHNVGDRADVMLADARAVPLPDAHADLVTLVDVVEHLSVDELERTLSEARRLLRPGGRLIAHTAPNRDLYRVTYRLQRWVDPRRRRRWPVDPRNAHERRMHVNEQTVGSLRRALRRAKFRSVRVSLGAWVYTDFVPDERARRLYHRLAAHRLTRRFGIADLWAEGRRA